MDLTPVQSSLLVAIGFDPATNELIIQFPRGATYAYSGDKARHHYDQLMHPETESVGKYFLSNIKHNGNLTYRRIDAGDDLQKGDVIEPPKGTTTKERAAKGLKAPDPLKQLF